MGDREPESQARSMWLLAFLAQLLAVVGMVIGVQVGGERQRTTRRSERGLAKRYRCYWRSRANSG